MSSVRRIAVAALVALIASSCQYLARVSTGSADEQLSSAVLLDVSADGRFVLFRTADSLEPLDTNAVNDLYRKDTLTGAVVLISPGADGPSFGGTISDDGNWVAFWSTATNLVVGDTNARSDAFLRNVGGALTVMVSNRADGSPQMTGVGNQVAISGDGQYVAFETRDPLVPADTNSSMDVYRYNRVSGGTLLISDSTGGTIGDGDSDTPSISYDGAAIAFASRATNLVPNDTNMESDVFVWLGGPVFRASVDAGGAQANGDSENPSISGNGLAIAFETDATNLVLGDTNARRDVYVKTITGPIFRASIANNGAQPGGDSSSPSMNHDGTLVVFDMFDSSITGSSGRNLVVRDGLNGTTHAVRDGNGDAVGLVDWDPVMAADGVYVGITTSDGIAPDDDNTAFDGYLLWWAEEEITSVSPDILEPLSPPQSETVTITGSGFNRFAEYDVYTDRNGEPHVAFNNVVVVDDTTITFDVTVRSSVTRGDRDLWLEGIGDGPGVFAGSLEGCLQCVFVGTPS